jgi:SAM-dependent methyltransferase
VNDPNVPSPQSSTRRSYERIPYRSKAWPASAPAHLHTLALLRGLAAAPPHACRVLELGCADGGNLIPLAAHHPEAAFVGIDLVKLHVDRARARCAKLRLANARFEACSFVALDGVLEPDACFDYVIAHGLMSWLTPMLQAELLRVCAERLAPTGVALITYNTYPGGAARHSIREILQQHNRGVADIALRVERSRDLLALIAATTSPSEKVYAEQIREVLEVANDPGMIGYFAHEYLEEENHPFFVRDFVEAAQHRGLQYLADADIADMQPENLPAEVNAQEMSRIERLQLQDLLTNRKFRQSLLCHASASLRERPDSPLIESMYVTTELAAHGDTSRIAEEADLELRDGKGRAVVVDEPIVKAALLRFSEVDRHPIAFERLLAWAGQRVGRSPQPAERSALIETLRELQRAGMLTLRASAPGWAARAGERPVASPLVRAHDDPERPATSLRHHSLSLENATVREVLSLLDGSRDRAELLEHFRGRLDAAELERILELAATKALLVAERA